MRQALHQEREYKLNSRKVKKRTELKRGLLKIFKNGSYLWVGVTQIVLFSYLYCLIYLCLICTCSLMKCRYLKSFTVLKGACSGDVHQFSSVAQLCPTLCDPMNRSTPGLPVHHQLLELAQTHVHWVNDAIQPSNPLTSPSPPAFNLSQHQGLF